MRNRSNTVSPIGNIARGIQVGIVSKPTLPAPKRLLMPLSPLDRTTVGTGDAGVGGRDHGDSNAHDLAHQEDTFGKEPARPLLPARESLRVFQGYALARALCHGHRASGFTGKHLFLIRSIRPLIDALLLLHGTAVTLFLQDGAQVRACGA